MQHVGDLLRQLANFDPGDDLVCLATLAGAEVDLVKGHEILQQMGGIGALLRYRPRWV